MVPPPPQYAPPSTPPQYVPHLYMSPEVPSWAQQGLWVPSPFVDLVSDDEEDGRAKKYSFLCKLCLNGWNI
jgi:hypothetical protein